MLQLTVDSFGGAVWDLALSSTSDKIAVCIFFVYKIYIGLSVAQLGVD